MIMSIDDEIAMLVAFLKHPAGFDVDSGGVLCIRPISEDSPPTFWEVDWEEPDGSLKMNFSKEFSTLQEAARFFVEKRRYMCNGLDFESEYYKKEESDSNV